MRPPKAIQRLQANNIPGSGNWKDDFSRELYAAILPDKTQYSAANFLKQVLEECPYTIETWYTDNGTGYRGNSKEHAFMKLCQENKIEQAFTRVKTPRTVNNAAISYRKRVCVGSWCMRQRKY